MPSTPENPFYIVLGVQPYAGAVIVPLISSSGSVLVAITALVLNYRGFASIDARMLSLESRVDSRLNMMQADMKDLNKTMTALEIDVALLKDKAGL